jgi:dihydrofolate reductase
MDLERIEQRMPLALIVAAAENGVIGIEGRLPWRLAADLKRFQKLTMGHHLIMGRKTLESIGRLLPGRTTVIVTRQRDFRFPGASVAGSVNEALQLVGSDPQPFVVGGAQIYAQFLPLVSTIYLTRVHTVLAGDTLLPELDWERWIPVETQRFGADAKNEFDYSFETYHRK